MDKKEIRFITADVRIEQRMSGDDSGEFGVVEGYAAKFNQVTVIGGYFREVIEPGFFDDVLGDDVRCLKNHDPNFILSRSVGGVGTLRLSVDDIGLKYEYKTPDISYARDLQKSIELGDVNQSSFSFYVKEEIWSSKDGEMDLRRLTKCEQLMDVSPVTFPAYADTTVAKRSHEDYKIKNADAENGQSDLKKLSLHEARHIITINKSL